MSTVILKYVYLENEIIETRVILVICETYTVSQKTWCPIFAITSSNVDRFKNSFTVGNSGKLAAK